MYSPFQSLSNPTRISLKTLGDSVSEESEQHEQDERIEHRRKGLFQHHLHRCRQTPLSSDEKAVVVSLCSGTFH